MPTSKQLNVPQPQEVFDEKPQPVYSSTRGCIVFIIPVFYIILYCTISANNLYRITHSKEKSIYEYSKVTFGTQNGEKK